MNINYDAVQNYFHSFDIQFVRYAGDLLTVFNNISKCSKKKFLKLYILPIAGNVGINLKATFRHCLKNR